MRIAYVGDNRDQVNWGGRGQSIALRQLLDRHFEITGVVPGLWGASAEQGDAFVGSLLPLGYIKFLFRHRSRSRVADLYLRLVEEPFGARDLVSEDPESAARAIMRSGTTHPNLRRTREMFERADAVIINGEGSGIFTTPFRRDFFFYLALVELAVAMGKPAFLVNGIIADCPFTGRNRRSFDAARRTLAKCTAVLVRDEESLQYLRKEMPEVTAEYVPDALFTWLPLLESAGSVLPANGDFIIPFPEEQEFLGKLDFSRPYVCIGGSSWAALHQEAAVECYLALVNQARELDMPVYLTQNCGGDRFLLEVARRSGCPIVPVTTPVFMAGAILANARAFISGRFHPTILASLGGTPCVFLGAHSHKMQSLQATLEYAPQPELSGMPTAAETAVAVGLAAEALARGDALRDRIAGVAARRCAEAAQLPERVRHHLARAASSGRHVSLGTPAPSPG